MAYITSMPLWICSVTFALPALVSWLFFGSRLGLIATLVWLGFGIFTTDYLPPISRMGMDYYKMPPTPDARHLRVLTIFEECSASPDIAQIAKCRPDIIFMQGCGAYNRTLKLAHQIFGRTASIKQIGNCAIIVSNGQVGPAHGISETGGLIVDWIPENSDLAVRLINISLAPLDFTHRFDVYSPACWEYFHDLRKTHRKQLQCLFQSIREVGIHFGEQPIILGGNFSATPHSPIFRNFNNNFKDCFLQKGAGYGATHPVDFPMNRLDRIFCTHPLSPVRAATIHLPNTLRRSILADISLP